MQQIMTRARHLRSSELFGKVFISPDRYPEERAEQQKLVLELKKRSNDEPVISFFLIRDISSKEAKCGKNCSLKSVKTDQFCLDL